jgi:RNA polymerase sigma-70 factor, ECF subfamily
MEDVHNDIEQEFLKAYDELADPVFRRCFFKTSDRDVAYDLTQDTFVRVWDYICAGNEVRNLKAFIFTVANNLIKDYYKKSKAIPMSSMYDAFSESIPDTREKSIENEAEVEQIIRILNELPDFDRDIMIMRWVEEKSPKEIAHILGERENTISVRIHRATKKVRAILT